MRALLPPALAAVTTFTIVAGAQPAASPKYHKLDQRELELLRPLYADATLLLEHGELAFAARQLEQAAHYFRAAAARVPQSPLPARRLCETLTLSGQRDAARSSCDQALQNRASPLELRAAVAALMLAPPTPPELAQALLYARRARELMPQQFYGYAAQCDIAARLGDRRMQKECVAEFRLNAPGEHAERAARELESVVPSPWRHRLGLLALAVLCLTTLLHALRRRLRDLRFGKAAVAAGTSALVLLTTSIASAEGNGTRWKIDPQNPEASVPSQAEANADPVEFSYFLMELADRGDDAMAEPDYPAAIRYYRALAKAAPGNAVPPAQLCKAHEAAGQREEALARCRLALGLPGARADDHVRFSRLTLAKPSKLTATEIEDVEAVARHLHESDATRPFGHHVDCELGARLEDLARLESCTAALAKLAPDDPKTLTFRWTLALQRGDVALAEELVDRARAADLAPAALERMQRVTADARSPAALLRRHWRAIVPIASLLAIGALLWLITTRRKTTLHPA